VHIGTIAAADCPVLLVRRLTWSTEEGFAKSPTSFIGWREETEIGEAAGGDREMGEALFFLEHTTKMRTRGNRRCYGFVRRSEESLR
jgi:hypothetical protein